MQKIESINELAVKIAQNPEFAKRFQEDPIGVLARITETELQQPSQSFLKMYWFIIISLVIMAVLAITGAIVVELVGKSVPHLLGNVGSLIVGALAGLMAPPPTNKK